MRTASYLVLATILFAPTIAVGDPGKDESGKRNVRSGYDWNDDGVARRRDRRSEARIPRGHMPPPGECRRWEHGIPAGHQPPPFKC